MKSEQKVFAFPKGKDDEKSDCEYILKPIKE